MTDHSKRLGLEQGEVLYPSSGFWEVLVDKTVYRLVGFPVKDPNEVNGVVVEQVVDEQVVVRNLEGTDASGFHPGYEFIHFGDVETFCGTGTSEPTEVVKGDLDGKPCPHCGGGPLRPSGRYKQGSKEFSAVGCVACQKQSLWKEATEQVECDSLGISPRLNMTGLEGSEIVVGELCFGEASIGVHLLVRGPKKGWDVYEVTGLPKEVTATNRHMHPKRIEAAVAGSFACFRRWVGEGSCLWCGEQHEGGPENCEEAGPVEEVSSTQPGILLIGVVPEPLVLLDVDERIEVRGLPDYVSRKDNGREIEVEIRGEDAYFKRFYWKEPHAKVPLTSTS
jgi:hypothetical protein